MSGLRRLPGLYVRIVRTYFRRAGSLLPLAGLVFVPLGLVHAIPLHADLNSLDAGGALKLAAVALAVLVLGMTGLLGEVFYAGAVGIALTRSRDGESLPLREVVRMISYGRLVAVDLLYGAVVILGLVAFFIPGLVIYVYLGLAAPLVEIERKGVRDAFATSASLVRGSFWLVAAVLLPFELAGDSLTDLATSLAHSLLGGSLFAEWAADTITNVLFTPFYAVAAVLLTVDLLEGRRSAAPRIDSEAVRA